MKKWRNGSLIDIYLTIHYNIERIDSQQWTERGKKIE